jgi:hypothetical protein
VSPEPLIDRALRTIEDHEADRAALGSGAPAPALPLPQTLLLAIYNYELRRRRGLAPDDRRPDQLIRSARDASIPETEIQAALDAAARRS